MYDPDISPKQDKKIRVLLVITRLTFGGDTNVILDIASHFGNHPDFEASLAIGPVPNGETDLTHLAYDRGIPTIMIPSLVNRMNPVRNLAAVRQLRSIMVQGKYDIVHTHSSVAGIVGRTAALAARTPIIVHHVHGWGLREDMSPELRVVYLTLERLCARFTSRMIAVSAPTIEKGLDYHICRKEKFALIYNGLHLEKFSRPVDRERVLLDLGLDPACKIVGMIGRLDKQKNPLDFIRTAALVVKEYPKVQFLIAGDGCLRSDCERLIRELGLEGKFFLLGFRDDIDQILPTVNITALSSLWEGLPVVFQEAMSAGKPIVANNVDGVSDVVINGETGYLVPPHRPQEMAERILYLLNNDELSTRFGLTAERNSRIFSSARMIEKIESLYRDLLASRVSDCNGMIYSPPATWKRRI
jgi:glycosyltransferase involved in cell wall biosynthesis